MNISIVLLNFSLLLSPAYAAVNASHDPATIAPAPQPKRLVKILSIDGGGVRGLIPAMVLAELESRLPKGQAISDHFDIISGTSSGGMIALMLSTPDDFKRPKYTARYIADELQTIPKQVFSRTPWHVIKSGDGWIGAKYDANPLQTRLRYYFQNQKLSRTLTNVIIPTYEIEEDTTYFFKSASAKLSPSQNCLIRELAYATSAAPTYFPPALLNVDGNPDPHTFIDGGIAINNPTLAAAVHAVELYGNNIELFIVSLGTGTEYGSRQKKFTYTNVKNFGLLGWAKDIIDVLLHSDDQIVDYQMYYVFNYKKPQYYFRFQSTLDPKNADLDDVSNENIEALKNYAHALIEKNSHEIDYIAQVLTKNAYIPHPEEKIRLAFN